MQEVDVCLDTICLASKLTLESGGETYRAEETVLKMAQGFGLEKVNVFVLPTVVTISLFDREGQEHTRIVRIYERAIDLKKMDECNSISRAVYQHQLSPAEALARLRQIESMKKPCKWVLILACALSSAFFTLMFDGTLWDFLISAICGTLTEIVLLRLESKAVPAVVSGMIAGFMTTFVALAVNRLYPALFHTEPIISGAIMPLLPGLAFTSAVRDTIRGDIVSGGAKVSEAILRALTLGSGIAIMISLWGELFR